MILELAIVLALTLVNGVLAMSELAIVSSRPARLRVLADSGSRGAAIALQLADDPGRFLSSVQIGITLVGVLSGAFSGATLDLRLAAALQAAGLSPTLAQPLGVGGWWWPSPICRRSLARWCPSRSPCAPPKPPRRASPRCCG